ncbi:MAG: hypothetical protein IJZ62_04820 [Clostridia bacterium]|nr:hypothetical protein [Clostridia bacterium]
MAKLRVLGLNDDNHETSFHTECAVHYYNHVGLIEELAKPHDFEYEVRWIYLVDFDEDDVQLIEDFEIVSGNINRGFVEFTESFNRLWEKSKDHLFC